MPELCCLRSGLRDRRVRQELEWGTRAFWRLLPHVDGMSAACGIAGTRLASALRGEWGWDAAGSLISRVG
jgi:hypothetical protein